MQAALKVKTTVLPGHRVEFTAPELPEGEDVELIVLRPGPLPEDRSEQQPQGVWDWLQTLKPVQRTPEEWEAIEREIQAEKDSWDF